MKCFVPASSWTRIREQVLAAAEELEAAEVERWFLAEWADPGARNASWLRRLAEALLERAEPPVSPEVQEALQDGLWTPSE